MRVGISSTETDADALLERVRAQRRDGRRRAGRRGLDGGAYVVPAHGEKRFTVAALDLGIKAMTPSPDGRAGHRGARAARRPRRTTTSGRPAPTGSSSPTARATRRPPTSQVELLQAALADGLPYFGICFGNQLFGRALGFGTYKLKYGHRGINQPVMDRTTGKVEVTAHNHGFAVDAPLDAPTATPYGVATVSHVCLNDDVVEGLELRSPEGDLKAFSVQYHPEAAAGPHDAAYLFDRFTEPDEDRCPSATTSSRSWSSAPGRSSSARRASSTTPGTQACRVLLAEGIRVVLVNSNPATIMTDPEFADATYVEPITPEFVEKVIEKERPDALLATLGGQTALNAAMALDAAGVLEKYGVELIGASIEAIDRGENRQVFKKIVEELGGEVARSADLPLDGGLPRRRRRSSATRSSCARRSRWAAPARAWRTTRPTCGGSPAPACRPARPPRCSSRSRSSAGRSTSSRSCATPRTTW